MQAFDVLVVGGGHAGCEAAAAAARMGARVALVTRSADDLGTLSCNPAIGGLGKGHLVREIDALDGLIGRVADAAGLHFRLLNRSKGPAVQGPRVQVDRRRYRAEMSAAIAAEANITLVLGDVLGFIGDGAITGVDTSAGRFSARAVVVTTGTFLAGTLHHGRQRAPGGRAGGAPASALATAIAGLGLPRGRFKTGTPPRLDGRTIDWSRLDLQDGDAEPTLLSDATEAAGARDAGVRRDADDGGDACAWSAPTSTRRRPTAATLPGRGPRYCPSLEDKVVRFAERDGHTIFLRTRRLWRRHGLPERHFDRAAAAGTGRAAEDHSGTRTCGHPSAGLCGRI